MRSSSVKRGYAGGGSVSDSDSVQRGSATPRSESSFSRFNDSLLSAARHTPALRSPAARPSTAGGGSASAGPANRVHVGVRVRPPFEEEGPVGVTHILPSPVGSAGLPKCLQLDVAPGKRREFTFDAVFGPHLDNNDVYNAVGGPVVAGVLKGVPGTILAYGQTGSGKTHSLGILSRVTGESGIIPRALSHIFGAIAQEQAAGSGREYSVTASFAQIYLDSVQDLLVAAAAAGGAGDGPPGGGASLPVREDPARGFYVEGLSEYAVRSFDEAVALLNWGLERRVLGATRMNVTSSRSHTILTVRVEARSPAAAAMAVEGGGGGRALLATRAQLLICDLAGSERVRRTSSKGARLDEARAINASLHCLGQVIAALSAISTSAAAAAAGGGAAAAAAVTRFHVPWRDSKLTRLLYGNLGGSANTFLLATCGPAPRDATETLSTLLFASRCMRVAAVPVAALAASQADYAELAAKLQARLSDCEARHSAEVAALCARYEAALADSNAELTAAQMTLADHMAMCPQGGASYVGGGRGSGVPEVAAAGQAPGFVPAAVGDDGVACIAVSLFGSPSAAEGGAGPMPLLSPLAPAQQQQQQQQLRFLWALLDAAVAAVLLGAFRARKAGGAWARAIDMALEEEAQRVEATAAMHALDDAPLHLQQPGLIGNAESGGSASVVAGRAASLRHSSPAAALIAVHRQHPSNNTGRAPETTAEGAKGSGGSRLLSSSGGDAASLWGSLDAAVIEAEEADAAAAVAAAVSASPVPALVPVLPTGVRLTPVASAVLGGRLDFGGSAARQQSSPPHYKSGGYHIGGAQSPVLAQVALDALHAAQNRWLGSDAASIDDVGSSTQKRPLLVESTPVVAARSPGMAASALLLPEQMTAEAMYSAIAANLRICDSAARVKDARFDDVKRHAASVEALLRAREEDSANQRYVLRYLVDTAASLRAELQARGGGGGGRSAPQQLRQSQTTLRSMSNNREHAAVPSAVGSLDPRSANNSSAADSCADGGGFASEEDGEGSDLRADSRPLSRLMQRRETITISVAEPSSAPQIPVFVGRVVAVSQKVPTSNSGGGDLRQTPLGPAMPTSVPPQLHSTPLPAPTAVPTPTPPSEEALLLPWARASGVSSRDSNSTISGSVALPAMTVTHPVAKSVTAESSVGRPPRAPAANPNSSSSSAAAAPREASWGAADTGNRAAAPVAAPADAEGEGSDDIECIVGKRIVGAHLLYKVHWRNSESVDDEWFAREDLVCDFPRVVKAYEQQRGLVGGPG